MATSSFSQAQLTPAQVNASESAQWRDIVRRALVDTRVASPAFLAEDMVVNSQTVTVQITIQERVRTLLGPKWYDINPIFLVPIVLPRGGGFSITLPLKKGDEGLLVFCDCCFDQWWHNGQTNSPVADNNKTGAAIGTQQQIGNHRHEVGDCGFIPGMWSQQSLLANYSANSLQVRADDGSAIVDVSSGAVKVMNFGGTPLALMNDNFFQWWSANIFPFLVGLGYLGPGIPTHSETTVLKGQ